jgi:hypothetical protein
MKHLLIALGFMSSRHCTCDKHFNNPSLVSGYSYSVKQHAPTRCQIKRSMELAEDFQDFPTTAVLSDTMSIKNLR